MSKRIVITCMGSYGDLFPYIGLALELQSRGHVAVLATSECYRELVEREGIAFRAVGPDINPSDPELLARVMDPNKGTEVVVRELATPYVRQTFGELNEAAVGADLLVTHPLTFAGRLVAETRRMPWLSTVLAPISMFSVHDFPLLPQQPAVFRFVRGRPWGVRAFLGIAGWMTASWTAPVREFRRELGLPGAPDPLWQGQYSPLGTLALFSQVLGRPQLDWPARTTQSGFIFYDGANSLPEDLVRFLDAGDPPIVFTLGSSAVGAAGAFYEESLTAVTRLGRRAVFLIGKNPRNRGTHPPPDHAIAVDYAPHAALFPRAAAVVHHGGVGTTAQALRAGKPMLVVAHAHDQPDNGFRVARLGVARTIDARRYTAARAAGQLAPLLSDASYRDRAKEISAIVLAEHGRRIACDAILAAAGA